MKQVLFSIVLFIAGLGFITGLSGSFQQGLIAFFCFAFLTWPLYKRVHDFMKHGVHHHPHHKKSVV